MMGAHATAAGELREVLDQLASVADRHTERHLAEVLRGTSARLAEHRFNLVVFGEFKRGKSTLVNALIGHEVLPTALTPLTSAITIVRYGRELSARIVKLDRTGTEIAVEDLPQYITELGNPDNEKGVDHAVVSVPAPILADGLQLIDTPGTGSIFLHNTATARGFLSSADAALFVLSSDPPMSDAEATFLQTVCEQVPRVFVVVNKADRLAPAELEQALDFTREAIRERLDLTLPVIAVSSKLALEGTTKYRGDLVEASGFGNLVAMVTDFLQTERAAVALQSARRTVTAAEEVLSTRLSLQQAVLTTPFEEIQSRLTIFTTRLEKLRAERERNLFLLREKSRQDLVASVEQDLEVLKRAEFPNALVRLKAFLDNVGPRVTAAAAFQQASRSIADTVDNILGAWRQEEEVRINARLEGVLEEFSQQMDSSLQGIHEAASDAFGVQLKSFAIRGGLTDRSRFSLARWQAEVHLSPEAWIIARFLPARFVRRWIERTVTAKLWEMFEMSCGRIRYDFVRRIEPTVKKCAQELVERAAETEQAITEAVEQLARQRQARSSALEAELAALERERVLLHQLAERASRAVAVGRA